MSFSIIEHLKKFDRHKVSIKVEKTDQSVRGQQQTKERLFKRNKKEIYGIKKRAAKASGPIEFRYVDFINPVYLCLGVSSTQQFFSPAVYIVSFDCFVHTAHALLLFFEAHRQRFIDSSVHTAVGIGIGQHGVG